jgi:F0F1-type ATP synthase beta subunit
MVALMLAAGADANQPAASGVTPLDAARMRGRDDIARALLDAGARDVRSGSRARAHIASGTGIKAVDLFAPFEPGDRVLYVTQPWVGSMVLLGELSRRSADRGERVVWTGHVPRPWDEADILGEIAELGLTGAVEVVLGDAEIPVADFVALFTAPGSDARTDATLRALADSQPSATVFVVTPWTEATARTSATPGSWDACISFDKRLAARQVYPAISGDRSWSRRRAAAPRHLALADAPTRGIDDIDTDAGTRVSRFLAQRFLTAEPFSGGAGTSVERGDMLRELETLLSE